MLPEKVCVSRKVPWVDANPTPCNNMSSSTVSELKPSGSHFKVTVTLQGRNRSAVVVAMVDSGATALFISERFVRKNRIRTCPLQREIPLYNIDGSKNRNGEITRFASLQLCVGGQSKHREFLVTDLGLEEVVLGLPWLREVNPSIDWAEGTMELGSAKGQEDGIRVERVVANRMQQR